jgi:WD40 repeat protein
MHILCPHCHNPIEVVQVTPREEIACPSCGSSFRLETESTIAWQRPGGQKLGRFELLDTVGHGAFGTVYKARDPELDRTVAIKVPRAGNLAGAEDLDRFLREARSVAQLRHPSIVTVHEVGQQNGVPYLVSDFVQGVTLADLLSARRPAFREAAELVAAVADALQYAHEHGVIHRDVKPSNILLGEDGRPCVMDFGLAKRDAGEITMTLEGQVLGTPAYMSPEQARGDAHRVDGRSDVYSLGVVLYQMLTGELPFRGTQRMLLHQVLHDEPRPPRRLNDRIGRDLETICLKALAREPSRRYASARDLADDLRRWLKGEPIKAKAVGPLERGWRWLKRHPAAAAFILVSAVAVSALVGAAVGLKYNADLQELNGRLQAKNTEAEHQRQLAQDAERQAVQQQQLARRYQYAADVSLARRLLEGDMHRRDRDRVDELLRRHQPRPGQPDPRGFEWYYLWRLYHREQLTIYGQSPAPDRLPDFFVDVAFVPEMNAVRAVTMTGGVKYFDRATGELRRAFQPGQAGLLQPNNFGGNKIVLSPDVKLLTVPRDEDRTLVLWRVTDGTIQTELKGHQAKLNLVLFAPDSRTIATRSTDGAVKVWDADTGKERFPAVAAEPLRAPKPPPGGTKPLITFELTPGARMHPVAFAPDSKTLAVGSKDRTIVLYDVATGKARQVLEGHAGLLHALAFSPDGQTLAAVGEDKKLELWDVAGGKLRATVEDVQADTWGAPPRFAPDGKSLVIDGARQTVKVLDLSGLAAGVIRERTHFDRSGDAGKAVVYSPDGKRAAIPVIVSPPAADPGAGILLQMNRHEDGTVGEPQRRPARVEVKLVELASGKTLDLRGHSQPVFALAFTPDGTTLATGGFDGLVKVWDVATGRERGRLLGHAVPVLSVAFSPDGQTLASAGCAPPGVGGSLARPAEVKLWDRSAWENGDVFRGSYPLALSPDGRTLALGNGSPSADPKVALPTSVRLWDTAADKVRCALTGPSKPTAPVAFSHDDRLLATVHEDNTVLVWETATGRVHKNLGKFSQGVDGVAFSPSDRVLAVAQRAIVDFSDFSAGANGVKIKEAAKVTLRAVSDWHEVCTVPGHAPINFVPLSGTSAAADALLITGGGDRTFKVWEPDGRLRFTLSAQGTSSLDARAVSPSGKLLAAALKRDVEPNPRSELKIWDLTTGAELATLLEPEWDVQCLTFSPDSKTLVTGHGNWFTEGGTIKLRDPTTLQPRATFRGHVSRVDALAFTPDGNTLASADATEVKLWDLLTGQELATLPGSQFVRFTPDGKTLFTGPGLPDEAGRLFRAATEGEVRQKDKARAAP